ncbi:Mis12-domain-containing protein [Mycena kentingensis (nom. inval.)]|nr:Mis12-domain-containing protein [Mycena kentingensis (nom. inval.)]
MSTDAAKPQLLDPILLAEALGFSPQLLLDDLINVANQTVQDGVNGVEDFLRKRSEELGQEDTNNEIEQGLVAFQTLLEFLTDVAFDFLEAWALRNIFAVPRDLPIVMPHNEGLDLTHTSEEVKQLLEEVNETRAEIFRQRKLRQELMRATQRRKAETRRMRALLDKLAPYEAMEAHELPDALVEMQAAAERLPELQPATINALSQLRDSEEGTRQWELGKTGYIKWATAQLLAKADAGAQDLLPEVVNVEQFANTSAALDKVSRNLSFADAMDET